MKKFLKLSLLAAVAMFAIGCGGGDGGDGDGGGNGKGLYAKYDFSSVDTATGARTAAELTTIFENAKSAGDGSATVTSAKFIYLPATSGDPVTSQDYIRLGKSNASGNTDPAADNEGQIVFSFDVEIKKVVVEMLCWNGNYISYLKVNDADRQAAGVDAYAAATFNVSSTTIQFDSQDEANGSAFTGRLMINTIAFYTE